MFIVRIISIAAALAAVVFVYFFITTPPLALTVAREIRQNNMIAWEAVSLTEEILDSYDGDVNKLFIDSIRLSDDIDLSNPDSCNCLMIIVGARIGAFGARALAEQVVKFVFRVEGDAISLENISATREMI